MYITTCQRCYNRFNNGKTLSLITLNCRSVKKKALSLCDFITSNQIDLFALTETWLGEELNKSVLKELVPTGYEIQHVALCKRRGGGVTIVHNCVLKLKPIPHDTNYTYFVVIAITVNATGRHFHLCVVHRPLHRKEINITHQHFFNSGLTSWTI